MLQVVLFDLDGTLMDTAPEIADAVNATLAREGLLSGQPGGQLPEALVRSWIGDGARALLSKALAHVQAPPQVAAPAWARFEQDYAQRCGTRSRLHDGCRAMLQRLRNRGLTLVLLTNKEAAFAHRLLTHHDVVHFFDLMVAGDTLPVKKPDPEVVWHALRALDLPPQDALLVGDSATDVRTARAAGVPVWLVQHGYDHGLAVGADAPDGHIAHFDQFDPPLAERLAIA